MVTASLLALLDDIAIVMDDVATLTKVATKKTAGVLGDDLALNAEQVSGVKPRRELPVVWAVAPESTRDSGERRRRAPGIRGKRDSRMRGKRLETIRGKRLEAGETRGRSGPVRLASAIPVRG